MKQGISLLSSHASPCGLAEDMIITLMMCQYSFAVLFFKTLLQDTDGAQAQDTVILRHCLSKQERDHPACLLSQSGWKQLV